MRTILARPKLVDFGFYISAWQAFWREAQLLRAQFRCAWTDRATQNHKITKHLSSLTDKLIRSFCKSILSGSLIFAQFSRSAF